MATNMALPYYTQVQLMVAAAARDSGVGTAAAMLAGLGGAGSSGGREANGPDDRQHQRPR